MFYVAERCTCSWDTHSFMTALWSAALLTCQMSNCLCHSEPLLYVHCVSTTGAADDTDLGQSSEVKGSMLSEKLS
jgi:hypothetical protein